MGSHRLFNPASDGGQAGLEPGCPSALRISPNELDTGTADSAFRIDNLPHWCLFFNRRPLESWRMMFRINLAMLWGRISDSQARDIWASLQTTVHAIFRTLVERE